jgi:hypothetical protein
LLSLTLRYHRRPFTFLHFHVTLFPHSRLTVVAVAFTPTSGYSQIDPFLSRKPERYFARRLQAYSHRHTDSRIILKLAISGAH